MRIYLDVPFKEKDAAKDLGARWDAEFRSWFVDAGQPLDRFVRWIPAAADIPGPTVTLPVVLLPTSCYRCLADITCVIGLRIPEESDWEPSAVVDDLWYVALEDCAPTIGQLLDPAECAWMRIGPLLHRRTRPRPDGYLTNTCFHCGATQGAFPLHEELNTLTDPDLMDVLWTHGVVAEYPEALLPRREAAPPKDPPALADNRSSSPRS